MVRRCEHRDLARVTAIERESFSDPYDMMLFEWLLLRVGKGFYVACQGDGEVVGYAVCGVSGRRGHLISIASSPQRRRSGVGTLLMRSVLDYLAKERVEEVLLEVRRSNVPAINFYRKLSFMEVGSRAHYYQDGEDAVIMCRRVRSDTTTTPPPPS